MEEQVKKLYDLRQKKDELKKQTSEVQKEIDAMEYKILKFMEDQGMDKVGTTVATVTRKVQAYPQVKDLDALVMWAAEAGRPDILQKRVSKAVFDEILESEGIFPDGIDTYQKKSLGFRKAK